MAMSGLMNSSPDVVRRVNCWFPIPPVMAAAIWPFTMLGPAGVVLAASATASKYAVASGLSGGMEKAGPQIGSGPNQGSDVLEDLDVVHTVMGVDAEAHARPHTDRYVLEAVECGEAGHIFFRSAD